MVDDCLVNEVESSPEEEVDKVATTEGVNPAGDGTMVVEVDPDPNI